MMPCRGVVLALLVAFVLSTSLATLSSRISTCLESLSDWHAPCGDDDPSTSHFHVRNRPFSPHVVGSDTIEIRGIVFSGRGERIRIVSVLATSHTQGKCSDHGRFHRHATLDPA